MATAAGRVARSGSSTNGTKKFPQVWVKTKMKTTARPGRISGTTMRRNAVIRPAPSTHAASSSEIGTESMTFFVIRIAMGSEVADRNRTVPVVEPTRPRATNSA
jgi:hypothetical protein